MNNPRKLKRDNQPPTLRSANRSLEKIATLDHNRNKAFDMLVNEHKSVPTIAEELGIDKTTAYKWINHVHERTLAGISEKASLVRDRQNIQYDQLIERWMPLAVHENLIVRGEKYNRKGERIEIELDDWDSGTKAADIVLRAMAQKARNNGLHTVVVTRQGSPDDALRQFMSAVMPSIRQLITPARPELPVIQAEIIENESSH